MEGLLVKMVLQQPLYPGIQASENTALALFMTTLVAHTQHQFQ